MDTVTAEMQDTAEMVLRIAAPVAPLVNFARALTDSGYLPSDDLWGFLAEPWKWANEYVLWRAHGCPLDDDPGTEAFRAAVSLYQWNER